MSNLRILTNPKKDKQTNKKIQALCNDILEYKKDKCSNYAKKKNIFIMEVKKTHDL